MTSYYFLDPLDVLFPRGNRAFGDPGSFGEGLMPPWPSVAAGALRSLVLARDGVDLAGFAAGQLSHPTLGTPDAPGSFRVTAFHLARRTDSGEIEALIQPPADLVIAATDDGEPRPQCLAPRPLAEGLLASAPLPMVPVLAEPSRRKPVGGYWLTATGWARYLTGATPAAADLVRQDALWAIDPRVGVGLDRERRRADDGKLFSPQAIAPCPGVGLLVGIDGIGPIADGMLRLAGDGRGAALQPVAVEPPTADLDAIAAARRCRLVLTTPGLFPGGWRLPGLAADHRFELAGVRGRLVCAAVPRAEVVSGWDLARGRPKPAERAAPTGSVYWLDELDTTPQALDKLAVAGLWSEPCEDPPRRAEGFNGVAIAAWSNDGSAD